MPALRHTPKCYFKAFTPFPPGAVEGGSDFRLLSFRIFEVKFAAVL